MVNAIKNGLALAPFYRKQVRWLYETAGASNVTPEGVILTESKMRKNEIKLWFAILAYAKWQ